MASEGQPGVFTTTVNVLPGTHHIRFLVDGQTQTTPDYPTTVDFGNNLVNYIEVTPDDLPPTPAETDSMAESKSPQPPAQANQPQTEEQDTAPVPRDREVPPPSQFQNKIPKYLLDLDQPEESPLYHSAYQATEKLPSPPALPGFLSKPILNAATPRKDDNSVLTQPNHTVLNHLATSSIKNNVLAVSATTRYKSKVSWRGPTSAPSLSLELTTSAVCDNYNVQAHNDGGHLNLDLPRAGNACFRKKWRTRGISAWVIYRPHTEVSSVRLMPEFYADVAKTRCCGLFSGVCVELECRGLPGTVRNA